MNPYETLGVSKNASDEEIKKAYKKLAVKFHPDRNNNNAESAAKFKEISSAYNLIETAEKRQQFDAFGADGPKSFQFHSEMDIGSIFGDFFNMGRTRRHSGDDILVTITCTLEEIFKGFTRTVHYKSREVCDKCSGTGAKKSARCNTCAGTGITTTVISNMRLQATCMHCHGKGEVVSEVCDSCQGTNFSSKKDRQVSVSVPAGLESGSNMRFPGKGEPSHVAGGQPGNLYVDIVVKPHDFFTRQGQNLLCFVPLGYNDLVNGSKVKIKSFDGNLEFEVPAGTPSGTRFSLGGQGFPLHGYIGRGDIIVEVIVDIPKNVEGEYRTAIEKLKDYEAKYKSDKRKHYEQYLASEEKHKK